MENPRTFTGFQNPQHKLLCVGNFSGAKLSPKKGDFFKNFKFSDYPFKEIL